MLGPFILTLLVQVSKNALGIRVSLVRFPVRGTPCMALARQD
jgi:hypothetical protein